MVSAAACYAGGPGSNPAPVKWFLSLGFEVMGKKPFTSEPVIRKLSGVVALIKVKCCFKSILSFADWYVRLKSAQLCAEHSARSGAKKLEVPATVFGYTALHCQGRWS